MTATLYERAYEKGFADGLETRRAEVDYLEARIAELEAWRKESSDTIVTLTRERDAEVDRATLAESTVNTLEARVAELTQELHTVLDREVATQKRHDAKLDVLEARVKALEAALADMIDLAHYGDFRNGNTDSTGMIDEGDVHAGEAIDRARAALEAKP